MNKGLSNQIVIENISPNLHEAAQDFYQSVGYTQRIQTSDLVVTATLNSQIIGVVRLAFEHGFVVLRGMQILSDYQRLGLGSLMIKELEKHIGDRECYCIPYGWLDKFYAQIGFQTVDSLQDVPSFLTERYVENKKKYPKLILMKRDGL